MDSEGVLPESGVFIRVRVGNDDVSVVTESTDSPEDRARAVKAAESLSKRKDVKCAVVICYTNDIPDESTEETRYVWRVIHKPGQDSEWMTGGLVDLALTITLAPAGPTEPGDAALTLAKKPVRMQRRRTGQDITDGGGNEPDLRGGPALAGANLPPGLHSCLSRRYTRGLLRDR